MSRFFFENFHLSLIKYIWGFEIGEMWWRKKSAFAHSAMCNSETIVWNPHTGSIKECLSFQSETEKGW